MDCSICITLDMALLCLCELLFKKKAKNNGILQYICLRKEIEASKKLTDCLRERKERGNEKRLSCWALADECVLSHYSHTAQYAGQSGDNECSVWYLAFLPPPLLVWSALSVVSLFLHPYTPQNFLHYLVYLAFSRFNYLAISSFPVHVGQFKGVRQWRCQIFLSLSSFIN